MLFLLYLIPFLSASIPTDPIDKARLALKDLIKASKVGTSLDKKGFISATGRMCEAIRAGLSQDDGFVKVLTDDVIESTEDVAFLRSFLSNLNSSEMKEVLKVIELWLDVGKEDITGEDIVKGLTELKDVTLVTSFFYSWLSHYLIDNWGKNLNSLVVVLNKLHDLNFDKLDKLLERFNQKMNEVIKTYLSALCNTSDPEFERKGELGSLAGMAGKILEIKDNNKLICVILKPFTIPYAFQVIEKIMSKDLACGSRLLEQLPTLKLPQIVAAGKKRSNGRANGKSRGSFKRKE